MRDTIANKLNIWVSWKYDPEDITKSVIFILEHISRTSMVILFLKYQWVLLFEWLAFPLSRI